MAKRKKSAPSIADLQSAIAKAEKRVEVLRNKRSTLLAQLDDVNSEIAALIGKGGLETKPAEPRTKPKPRKKGKRGGKRGTRPGSLPDMMAKVLKEADGPMNAAEIGEAVLKAGYESKSKNMVALVREALSRVPGIQKASRGMYTVK